MESARLPDADLLQLVREGGETASPALHELEERHFHAVRAFASACAVSLSSADELAGQSWGRALRGQDGSAIGAVRPHALTVVLRTAADLASTGQRSALDFDLAIWLEANGAQSRAGAAGGYSAFFHRDSLTARAFGTLPGVSQTVLWHNAVEHEDDEQICQLLGSRVEEVALLNRRAHRELYTAYVQIHQDEMAYEECRRFHRMVLAYAEQRCPNAAADVVPHLERCQYCSRAVADLERMRSDCGSLLAVALLPWGGQEYAASGFRSASSSTLRVPGAAVAGAAGTARQLPAARTVRARGRIRRAAFATVGALGLHDRTAKGNSLRAKRLTQSVAFLGLCSLAVAFAYAGGLGPGAPQSNESSPGKKVPPVPGPSRPSPSKTATATATATVTATRTSKPPAGGGGGGGSASEPPVRGASVEWLFDKVKNGRTADTSGNGRNGTLVGVPLPSPLKSGAIQFFGQQSVASNGAVVDTTESFSVSARVKLQSDDEDFQTVVSQDGSEVSGFQLQYDGEEDQWEMRLAEDDTENLDDLDEATSESEAETGEWTYLTGVYDESDEEIRLYVDGELEDSHDLDDYEGVDAEGSFAAGRAMEGDEFVRGFEGVIDDVRAFPKAVSDGEAARLAGSR